MVKFNTARQSRAPKISTQSKHDRIIGELKKPWWMTNDSLKDNKWVIRTHGGKKRNGDVIVQFDVPIAPGVRSIDLEDDLITAKLLAYWGLTGNDARYESGATIPINNRSYFSFLRWRYARGIESNADLISDDFADLIRDLEEKGIVGLPPYEERFVELAKKVASGEFIIPFVTKGNRRFARKMALTEALGAPHTASLPPSIGRKIDALVEEHGFFVHPRKFSEDGGNADEIGDDGSDLSENRLISFLTVVQLLHYYRGKLSHDMISFQPMDDVAGIIKIAKSIAKVLAQRSFTTPTYQACFLIDKAITWVTLYFEEIKSFTADLSVSITKYEDQGHWRPSEAAFKERIKLDRGKYTSAAGSWWPVHPSYFASPGWVANVGTDRPSLRPVLFELLATAAFVVIASFSARRKEEMGSLKDDCVTVVDGEFWLETWISKNVRDMDKIPIPATVKRAIDVLLWLSEDGRLASGERWLLDFAEFLVIGDDAKVGNPAYTFYDGLDRFAEFVGVPLINGKRWIPKPTEFRRFFGMTYFHRYDFPNLVALSEFYRHYNPTRTRGYITEIAHGITVQRSQESAERIARRDRRIERFAADRLADFHEAGLEYRIAVVRDAVTGSGYMSGFGGATIVNDIKKQLSEYKAQMSIEPDAELDGVALNDLIRTMVELMSIDPHPNGHSACKCTEKTQDLANASCLRLRAEAYPEPPPPNRPEIEFATEAVCAGCVHNVQLPCHRRWWENALEHEHHESEHALLPFLREIAEERSKMMKGVLTRCHGGSAGAEHAK